MAQSESHAQHTARRPKRAILPILGIILGLAILAAPVVADLIEQHNARQTVVTATVSVQSVDPAQKSFLLQNAHAYNDRLSSHERAETDIFPYDQQLRYGSTSMMAYVEIPKINITLPVYHHADASELSNGAGHVEGTSLPVGGDSTHAVISAHSGVPTSRMFDDIGELEPGDTFTVRVLGDVYAYRVIGSQVVLPSEVDKIAVQPGRDLCTLVTCTPYGVNSHRLLVTGERCEYVPESAPAIYVAPRAYPLVIGLAVVGAVVIALSLVRLAARRRGAAKRRAVSG